MQQKSEAFEALVNFVKIADTQFNHKVKIIRSDNALEFQDEQCKQLYTNSGIIHQRSCVNTTQQNERAERKHRNILEMARCLRFQAGLPMAYWGDCVLTAAYLTNIIPSPVLKHKTPYEMMYNKTPTYSTLKVFGCLAFAHNPSRHTDKFSARGVPCVFIGYPATQKGYRLLNLLTNEVFVSKDIKWYEHVMPYTLSKDQLHQLVPPSNENHIADPSIWESSSDDELDAHDDPSSEPTPSSASPSASPHTYQRLSLTSSASYKIHKNITPSHLAQRLHYSHFQPHTN